MRVLLGIDGLPERRQSLRIQEEPVLPCPYQVGLGRHRTRLPRSGLPQSLQLFLLLPECLRHMMVPLVEGLPSLTVTLR